MRDGRILQVDTPQRLYAEPRNLFVAAFIGSPAMNLVEAAIDGDVVVFGQFRVPLAPGRRPPRSVERIVLGHPARVLRGRGLRAPGQPTIAVAPSVLEELGSDAHVALHRWMPRRSPPRRSMWLPTRRFARSSRRSRASPRASIARTTARVGTRSSSRSTRPASTSSTRRPARASSRAVAGRARRAGARARGDQAERDARARSRPDRAPPGRARRSRRSASSASTSASRG